MIRLYTPEDAQAMLKIYTPYITKNAVSFEYDVPSLEAFQARLNEIFTLYPVLIYEMGGVLLGYAYAHRQRERKAFDWNAELSIYLSDQAFGTGAGKALYGALYALLRMQHIHTLHAYITYPNPQSVSFHRKMGFEMAYIQKNAGYKLDKWHDLAWMICQLDSSNAAPEAYIPFRELDKTLVGKALEEYNKLKCAVEIRSDPGS